MFDRAIQALYKRALAPVAETTADRNSYGFREGRSCADAVAAACNALPKSNSATWTWEDLITGDIKDYKAADKTIITVCTAEDYLRFRDASKGFA
jgi:retron-type reverse transcriptase